MYRRLLILTSLFLLPLLGACVTKGTHNTALGELATSRAAAEEQGRLVRQLRDSAAAEKRSREASEDMLRQESARLQAEVARLDALQRGTRAEALRLETALGQRGAEYRQLQQRLESLAAIEREIRDRNRIYEDVLGRFQSLIDGGQLTVAIVRGRMVIQLPQDILFQSGSAVIAREGQATLASVAAVLVGLPDRRFQIEGHTDNVPIATARFPSNWELSSARALSVVRLLVQENVKPENVSGAGYGEFQPVAANDAADTRRLNRRIEIVMLPNLDVIAATQVPG